MSRLVRPAGKVTYQRTHCEKPAFDEELAATALGRQLAALLLEGALSNALGVIALRMGLAPDTPLRLSGELEAQPDTGFVKAIDEMLAEARREHPAPAGLADLHREEQGRVPVGCDGARLRSAGGLGARGLQATGVVLVGGQVAVVVAFAGPWRPSG